MAYTPLSEDTSIDAEKMQFQVFRQAGPSFRLALCARLSCRTRQLCLSGLKRRESDPEVVRRKFFRAVLGFEPDFTIWGTEEMWIQDSVELAQQLHPVLENAKILYFVTGGIASSYHGEPRSTQDLDVVVQIQQNEINQLVAALTEQGFYVPEGAISDIMHGVENKFNIVHQQTSVKADVMISSDHPFDVSQMQRRELSDEGFYLCTAEDIILQKLKWGRKSLSDKQWRDVQGILRMQGETLDLEYMYSWAEQIGCLGQLNEAIDQSGMQR